MSTDMFGDQRVEIKGNPILGVTANHLLQLINENPELLNGVRIGDIDKKLRLAVWVANGLDIVLGDKLGAFEEWASDTKRCIDPEVIRRARQYLVEHDYIRISAQAIRDAERKRLHIASTLR